MLNKSRPVCQVPCDVLLHFITFPEHPRYSVDTLIISATDYIEASAPLDKLENNKTSIWINYAMDLWLRFMHSSEYTQINILFLAIVKRKKT